MLAVVPTPVSQTFPQPPQLLGSASVLASHPLFGLPSQSDHPFAHTGTHVPAGHVVEPCWFVHVVPQAPQLATLQIEVSHPSAGVALQSFHPASHVATE